MLSKSQPRICEFLLAHYNQHFKLLMPNNVCLVSVKATWLAITRDYYRELHSPPEKLPLHMSLFLPGDHPT